MKASNRDDDDDFDDDDDERKTSKRAKFASNDRSGHDDQFCQKIVKIGAILAIFEPLEVCIKGFMLPGATNPQIIFFVFVWPVTCLR